MRKYLPKLGENQRALCQISGLRTKAFVLLGLAMTFFANIFSSQVLADEERPPTFCNPINLPYRFQLDRPVRREAADPTMAIYHNEYWLFPSKSGGCWHSPDCLNWTYVPITTLPVENYAPTVEIVDGRMLWTASGAGIYGNDDPSKDSWKQLSNINVPTDPDLFLASDGRLFLYGGCSDASPTNVVELDKTTLKPIGKPVDCVFPDTANRGWETLRKTKPWIEGSWMNEYNGTYYLQYAAPGTEIDEYGDGVFTSKNPLGPFTYAPYSPFSFKPTGFARSAGHSSTFKDLAGNYWHVSTMVIGARHVFERRLGLFPAGFTEDGQLFCDTYLGDYPQYPPGAKPSGRPNSPGWMLLSYDKAAEASSTLDGHPIENAFDENMRHWWSAKSGDKGEWLKVDLGKPCRIEAIQSNFADQDADALGVLQNDSYQYVIEGSANGTDWTTLVDQSQNHRDAPHDYVQLPSPVTEHYVRITNIHCPAGAKFSLSGFRIFGNGLSLKPDAVTGVTAPRSASDPRLASVSWSPVANADFYIVRFGLSSDTMFENYQIYHNNHMTINALNIGASYKLTVDAVNDSGVTKGVDTVSIP